jgi:hypothetical protein
MMWLLKVLCEAVLPTFGSTGANFISLAIKHDMLSSRSKVYQVKRLISIPSQDQAGIRIHITQYIRKTPPNP